MDLEAEGVETFGAADVKDLSWKNLLDGYSCTECGRCTAACPANITGKPLSPRKIVVNVRQRTMAELSHAGSVIGALTGSASTMIVDRHGDVGEIQTAMLRETIPNELPQLVVIQIVDVVDVLEITRHVSPLRGRPTRRARQGGAVTERTDRKCRTRTRGCSSSRYHSGAGSARSIRHWRRSNTSSGT